jgi:hypothetical protein
MFLSILGLGRNFLGPLGGNFWGMFVAPVCHMYAQCTPLPGRNF